MNRKRAGRGRRHTGGRGGKRGSGRGGGAWSPRAAAEGRGPAAEPAQPTSDREDGSEALRSDHAPSDGSDGRAGTPAESSPDAAPSLFESASATTGTNSDVDVGALVRDEAATVDEVPTPAVASGGAAAEPPRAGRIDRAGWPERLQRARRAMTTPRAKRAIVATAFVGFVVACSSVLVISALTRAEPAWWGVVDSSDPKVRQQAEQLENGVTTLLSDPRPPNKNRDARDPWTVRLNATDANAWLNARLRQWLDTQDDIGFKWPEQVRELRVRFDDGRIYVGAKVDQNGASQIFTATLKPRFETDGALWMPAERIALGRLGVPAAWVLPGKGDDAEATTGSPVVERVGEVSEEIAELPQTRQVLRALAGANAVLSNPIVKLPDGRRVRLLALRAHDGGLLITCQTIIRDSARADGSGGVGAGGGGGGVGGVGGGGSPPPGRTGHVP